MVLNIPPWELFYVEAICPRLEDLELTITESSVKVKFSSSDLAGGSSQFSTEEKGVVELTLEQFDRLPHELVCAALGYIDSDHELAKIQKTFDISDRLTPDQIISNEDGSFSVIEVKTTKGGMDLALLTENAVNKYRVPLHSRSESNEISLYAVSVNSRSICTNLPLSPEEMENILRHYLLGVNLHIHASVMGWTLVRDKEEEKWSKELMTSLEGIKLDTERLDPSGNVEPLWIVEEDVEKWKARSAEVNSIPIWSKNMRKMPDILKAKVRLHYEEQRAKTSEGFEKLFDEIRELNTAENPKTVLAYPIALVRQSAYQEDWPARADFCADSIYGETTYSRLWNEAFLQVFNTQENYEPTEPERLLEFAYGEALKPDPDIMTHKSKHFTVKVELSNEDWEELACRGVGGKKWKNSELVKAHLEESRMPLSPDVDVSDIDESFEEGFLMITASVGNSGPVEKGVKLLVEKAKEMSEDSSSLAEQFITDFCNTELAHSLMFLDEVVYEVNLTRLKHMKRDVMCVKRLQAYNAYVMIKTTTNDNHVFFSVCVPKQSFVSRFPLSEPWLDIGDYFCTKFVSMDRHKITHKLYTTYKAACLYAFWQHQWQTDSGFDRRHIHKEVFTHFWASLMVLIEDKENTSRNLQQIRYAYMEVINTGIVRPKPEKIVAKLDKVVRSRLLMWTYRRLAESFPQMVDREIIVGGAHRFESEESQDKVGGLISWIDGAPLPRFEIALNLSYLGVLHNKEESNLLHGYLKIFHKMIDQELKLKEARPEHMMHSTEDDAQNLRDHEFSADAVLAMAKDLKEDISKKFTNYEAFMSEKIRTALVNKTFDDIATSKSSASEEDPVYKIVPNDDDSDMPQEGEADTLETARKKCIENTYNLVERLKAVSDKVFLYLPEILKDVEEVGGIRAETFKKLQIGGEREIFILTISSRIVVHFLETVARCICEESSCEMLTSGDQKIGRSDEHFRRKRSVMKDENSITLINSDDAQTWAQRFIMPCFGALVVVLVPEPFLTPCIRILNLVTSKRIRLPKMLLELFYTHQDVFSHLGTMNRLKHEFLTKNVDDRRLLEYTGVLMRNRSNMMQGILHYLSSLLHAAYVTSFRKFVEYQIKSNKFRSCTKVAITLKVSSDDSSMLISLNVPEGASLDTVLKIATAFCELKGHCYPLICSKQSLEKSTMANTQKIEEFNSLWYFRNTLFTPAIKFISQSCRTHATDRMEDRQQIMAGLRRQVFENTGSTLLTSIVQSAQLRCHYISLGLSAHKLFPQYVKYLIEVPHPSLGFFLMEHSYLCGILGYNYAFWQAVSKNMVLKKLCRLLISTALIANDGSDQGVCSLVLTQGSKTRYQNMLRRMELSLSEVMDYFDNKPDLLCRRATNLEEVKAKLALKATTPSLSNSFEFLTDSKLHASSSYVLHTHCISLQQRELICSSEEDGLIESVMTEKKVSLMRLVRDVVYAVQPEKLNECCIYSNEDQLLTLTNPLFGEQLEELSDEQEAWLFPNRAIFAQAHQLALNAAESSHQTASLRLRKLYIVRHIPKYDTILFASPLEVVKSKWFKMETHSSKYERDQSWQTMKRIVPWIKESFQESLKASPYQSSVGLINFLNTFKRGSTSIRSLCPCRSKPVMLDLIEDMIDRAFWPRCRLKMEVGETIEHRKSIERIAFATQTTRSRAQRVISALALVKEATFDPLIAENLVDVLVGSPDIIPISQANEVASFAGLTTEESKVAVLQMVAKHNVRDVSKVLVAAKRGLMGMFTERAKYSPAAKAYVGRSTYSGFYNNVPFRAIIDGNVLIHVILRSKEHIAAFSQGIWHMLKGLSVSKITLSRPAGGRRAGTARRGKAKAPRQDEGLKFPLHYYDLRHRRFVSMPGEQHLPLRFDPLLRLGKIAQNVVLRVADNHMIRLMDESREGKEFTVLNFFPHLPKYPLFVDREFEGFGPRLNSWVQRKSLSEQEAEDFVFEAVEYLKTPKPEEAYDSYSDTVLWLRRTLRDRAIGLHLIRGVRPALAANTSTMEEPQPLSDIEVELEEDAEFEEFRTAVFADFTFEELISNVKVLLADQDLASNVVEMDNPDEEREDYLQIRWSGLAEEGIDVGNELFQRLEVSEEPDAKVSYNHTFWDLFLKELQSNSSFETRTRAFSGVYHPRCAPSIQAIAELYGAVGPTLRSAYSGTSGSIASLLNSSFNSSLPDSVPPSDEGVPGPSGTAMGMTTHPEESLEEEEEESYDVRAHEEEFPQLPVRKWVEGQEWWKAFED